MSDNIKMTTEQVEILDNMCYGAHEVQLGTLLYNTAGQKTAEGGEIFNDYENNRALNKHSTAFGSETIAGGKAFKIINSTPGTENGTGIYTLSTVEGLEVGMQCAVKLSKANSNPSTIIAINGNDVTVDNYVYIPLHTEEEIEAITNEYLKTNYLAVIGKPYLGDMEIGFNSFATGESCIVQDSCGFATGYNNNVVGQHGFVAGRDNIVGYAGCAVGGFNVATGDYSHAEGGHNNALGKYSHAEGNTTNANGNHSHTEGINTSTAKDSDGAHAEGYKTQANAQYSHAEGVGTITKTTAYGAHAEGNNTQANGAYSHAEGVGTTANGNHSHSEGAGSITGTTADGAHAEGKSTRANGAHSHSEGINTSTAKDSDGAHAEGKSTQANAPYSHAEGINTSTAKDSDGAHAEGINTQANAPYSHAEGMNSVATGKSSHAEGTNTHSNGAYSHAEGTGTTANGNHSHSEGVNSITGTTADGAHAEGNHTQANGAYSHSEGNNTRANGAYSHSEGGNSIAKGLYSHAEGTGTTANGNHSHSEGIGTVAAWDGQHVQGKYNIADGISAHIVGNGTSDTQRRNAHTLDWSGNAWFAGDVKVGINNDKLATEKVVDDKIASIISIDGEAFMIDSELNKESKNAVQNKVVTNAIVEVAGEISEIKREIKTIAVNPTSTVVINTQSDFDNMVASSNWLGTRSVLFNTNVQATTTIDVPSNVCCIDGNGFRITFDSGEYFGYSNRSYLGEFKLKKDRIVRNLCVAAPSNDGFKGYRYFYSVDNCNFIFVRNTNNNYGFYECYNLSNCSVSRGSSQSGTDGNYGYYNCKNLIGCVSECGHYDNGFYGCENLMACSAWTAQGSNSGGISGNGFETCIGLSHCKVAHKGVYSAYIGTETKYAYFLCSTLNYCTVEYTDAAQQSCGFKECNNLQNCGGEATNDKVFVYDSCSSLFECTGKINTENCVSVVSIAQLAALME